MLLEQLGALLSDDLHLRLEVVFVLIGCHDILLGVASGLQVIFLLLLALCYVEPVESRLQVLHLVFGGSILAAGYFLGTRQHLLLVGVDFLECLFLGCALSVVRLGFSHLLVAGHIVGFRLRLVVGRCFRLHLFGAHILHFRSCLRCLLLVFKLVLLQNILLRVHHFTVLSL